MSAAAIVNEFGANPSQNYDVHKDTAGCWCKNRTLGYSCDMTSAKSRVKWKQEGKTPTNSPGSSPLKRIIRYFLVHPPKSKCKFQSDVSQA